MVRKGFEKGFTLIELLVVVAIIGILAAIAIPQYAAYKKNSVDAQMKSDLHNMATAMEAYYGSNANTYENSNVGSLKTFGYRQTASTTPSVGGLSSTSFVLTSAASGGNHPGFTFASDTGQILSTTN